MDCDKSSLYPLVRKNLVIKVTQLPKLGAWPPGRNQAGKFVYINTKKRDAREAKRKRVAIFPATENISVQDNVRTTPTAHLYSLAEIDWHLALCLKIYVDFVTG